MILNPLGVNADIAFNKVETLVTDETINRGRADIHTIDIVVAVFQQTFCQVVTDETVHTQDQHTLTAGNLCSGFRADADISYDTHFRCQTGTLHIQAGFPLAADHFQRAVSAGNHQRFRRNNGSRTFAFVIGQHAAAPDDHFALTQEGECTRIRFCHRTDQVVDLCSRLIPVDQTIFRTTAAEVCCLRFILSGGFISTGLNQR